MSHEIEKEQRYILKSLPSDISSWNMEFLADTYIPEDSHNPQIRLRQRGDTFFITKKYPKNQGDLSVMVEETISLTDIEYRYFRKNLPGKYLAKNRYKKVDGDTIIEVDEYQDELKPLIVMDLEWSSTEPNKKFVGQFNISQNITQINELAGGQLAGKTYGQIKQFITN